MSSINANTGLLFTPVDYEDDLLQSARDRVYTIRGTRRHRPDYGLNADYTDLGSLPLPFVQQAFASDPRIRVSSIATVYPVLNMRGSAVNNPYDPLVLTQAVTAAELADMQATFTPVASLYTPTSWATDQTTAAVDISIDMNAVRIRATTNTLDVNPNSEVYDDWYIYLKHSYYTWLIPINAAPDSVIVDGDTYTYEWLKDSMHLAPILEVIDEEWTLAFVRVEGWLTW